MKRIYNSPDAALITCCAPDILNSSTPTPVPYSHISSSDGEWLDWGQIKEQ